MNEQKLYLVTLQGISCGIGKSYTEFYVVAPDPTAAYNKVREYMDKKDIGFTGDRELKSVEQVASPGTTGKDKPLFL